MKVKIKIDRNISIIFLLLIVLIYWQIPYKAINKKTDIVLEKEAPTTVASPSAAPTTVKKPAMSFAEMEKKYGPCVNLPILMYHHVEDQKVAVENKRTNLNVPPEMFDEHLKFLKDKGYNPISPVDLINFFDQGAALPTKPVMITFDDGYEDNGSQAFPVLEKYSFKAAIFLATGLMDNPGYLSWSKVSEMMDSSLVYFGNHTWSHSNMGKGYETDAKEIGIAENQLNEKGLNEMKVFAYPYGAESAAATKVLTEMGFGLALTTKPGRIQCKGLRLDLPRIRVGNAPLGQFGL